jgi:hypothetical protein
VSVEANAARDGHQGEMALIVGRKSVEDRLPGQESNLER